MKIVYSLAAQVLAAILTSSNLALNWIDSHSYVQVDLYGTGIGGHIGLWLMRKSSNLKIMGKV